MNGQTDNAEIAELRVQVRLLRAERDLWRVRSRKWEKRSKANHARLREHGIETEDDTEAVW